MTEQGKKLKPLTIGLINVIGLVAVALGIVVPILWDRYKTKTALELRLISNSVVVTRSEGLDKLQFVYDGTSVPSLSRLEFVLANTGRTPIRQADIVSPPRVHVRSGRILDVRITRIVPGNLEVHQALEPNQETVSFSFPLFNPGDAFNFSLLISTDKADVEAAARIAGVDQLYVVTPPEASRSRSSAGLVGVMSGLSGFLFLIVLRFSALESAIAQLVRSGGMPIPTFTKAEDYSSWLERSFPEFRKKLQLALDYVKALPQGTALSEQQRQEIVDRIRNTLLDTRGSTVALIFLGILTIVGAFYALSRV